MWLKGTRSHKASELGTSLADTFVTAPIPVRGKSGNTGQFKSPGAQLQTFLAQVDRDVAPMQLGMFGRAKLASSFKWRLLDGGFEPTVADELTQLLLVRLSNKPATAPLGDEERFATLSTRQSPGDVETLLARADGVIE